MKQKHNINHDSLIEFWNWFDSNDQALFNANQYSLDIFARLSEAMQKVDSHLTFEIGPVLESGCRDFVISADGNLASFKFVEALYATAPLTAHWRFIRYRPRRDFVSTMTIVCNSRIVSAANVHYLLARDSRPGHFAIKIFIDCLISDMESREQIGYLFLHASLGEYDVESHVGVIEVLSQHSKYFIKARPITELPAEFDRKIGRR